jgi:hypothetical protein
MLTLVATRHEIDPDIHYKLFIVQYRSETIIYYLESIKRFFFVHKLNLFQYSYGLKCLMSYEPITRISAVLKVGMHTQSWKVYTMYHSFYKIAQ